MSYSQTLGRWLEQDPAGYIDGQNDYQLERGDPIEDVDPTGTRSVDIYIYIDRGSKPSNFNTANVTSLVNGAIGTSLSGTTDTVNVHISEKDNKPDDLGWVYDKPGAWTNTNSGWDYVPLIQVFTRGYRTCTRKKVLYTHWIYFNPNGNVGYAATGGATTSVQTTKMNMDAAGEGNNWNWDIVYANMVLHEALSQGALNMRDGGTPQTIGSGEQSFNTVATVPPSWVSDFKSSVGIK